MADPKIRIKRSAVAGRIPSVDQVPLGELALNTWDGQLYASKNVGLGTTVVAVNPWLVGTGTDSYNAYFTAGNIGIGSTTPTSALHVVGDAYVSGVVTANAGFNLGISSAGSVITSGPIKTLNFIGAGNTFLVNGTTVDISIQGGGGGAEIGVQANDSVIGYAQTTLNFAGTGVTGVSIGTTTTITIEPGLVGAAKSVTSFTATAGQTTFNVNYSAGQENVFLNGVRLSESQYTATNGSTVVLNDAASDGDSVDIVVYLRGSDPNRNVEVTLLPPFNGITTAFTMYKGSTSYLFDPIDERQIVVSLGGVIQQPGVAYTVGTGSSIFFSAAPGAATTCFITALYSNTVGVPTDAVFINKEVFNPTGVQTTFTIASGYTDSNIDIYRNGIRLVNGADYTATDGTTVDLVTPATGGDVVETVAYRTYIPPYFGNVKIGVGGTDLLVEGNARVTGILTVGIGTTNPVGLLDILGKTHNNVQCILTRGFDPGFQLQAVNSSESNSIGATVSKFGVNYASPFIPICGFEFLRGNSTQAGSVLITTGTSEKVRVTGTGRVGIGTTNPRSILHILDGSSVGFTPSTNYDKLIVENGTSSQGAAIQLVSNATNGFSEIGFSDSTRNRGLISYHHNDDTMYFISNGTERFSINSSGTFRCGSVVGVSATTATFINNIGRVGIKTDNLTYPLSISADNQDSGVAIYTQGFGFEGRGDWQARIVAANPRSTVNKSVFMGVYKKIPAIVAHNATLSSWNELWINGVSFAGDSEKVIIPGPVGIAISQPTSTLHVNGSVSKSSGSFRIDHPLPEKSETHDLVHSFIEGPRADLIYRGEVRLISGIATIIMDQAVGMTTGTWQLLCRDPDVFVTNNEDWTPVKAGITSTGVLTIEAKESTCNAKINWLVVAERHDKHMFDTEWTDDNGRVILEPLKGSSVGIAST